MLRGTGTVLNVATVLIGGGAGLLLGGRLPLRTRDVVTDALGLTTLLIAGVNATAVRDPALIRSVGSSAPVLVVLAALAVGGVLGSLLRLEDRVERLGGWLRGRLTRGGEPSRFVEGFVVSSLVFCVGPLTILGSVQDGLGHGIDQLALKSVLDGFAALAFAASYGTGVLAAALTVAVVQGLLTGLGAALGGVLDAAQLAALTATGGLLLGGVALRLLRLRPVPVADLLPALVLAPLFASIAAAAH